MTPDVAPFHDGPLGWRLEEIAHRTGYRGVYTRVLRVRRPQLFHVHFGTDASRVLPLLMRSPQPLVVTFHGYDVLRAPGLDVTGRYRQRLEQVFQRASLLLTVSDFLAGELRALGAPPEKIHVHHLGTRVAHPLPTVSTPRSGITFVGRLVPYKGVDDLIEAVARLPETLRQSTPVTIIGDGPARAELERHAARVPGASISFTGFRGPDEVRAQLARTRVFAGPSRTLPDGTAEAFGLVFLEAALAGAPTVAYDSGGVPSAVVHRQTGLLAPEGDVDALSANLLELLTNNSLAEDLGRTGQNRVVEHLDVARQTQKLEDLYDQVVRRDPHSNHSAGDERNS